jgi:hypothetical protein
MALSRLVAPSSVRTCHPTPASNIITFADRVYHAADRLRHQVATSKICAPLAQELVHVAYFDENEGRVIPMDADAELLLAQWLGMSELLGSQLECEGAQHFARQRELMAVAHGHNPGLAWWARQQLRQRGSH